MIKETENKYIPRVLQRSEGRDKNALPPIDAMEFARLPGPKVLLGAPGGGKTSVCKEVAATHQLNGQFVRANIMVSGSFKDTPQFDGQILVIDGLDEVYSRRSISEAFEEIIKTLKRLGYSNWLISCRSYEWDGELFDPLIENDFGQSPKIAHLGDLSNDEIKAFLEIFPTDEPAEQFIKNAEQKEATDFLRNPQTLKMLVQAVSSGRRTETKKDLFESACMVMASEHNPLHQKKSSDRPNEEKIIEISGWVCTQFLMSGAQAIALDGRGGKKIPRPADLEDSPKYSKKDIKAACQTKIFKPVEEEVGRVEPTHRTVAEFLAGHWLAEQFKANQKTVPPARRVMNYLTSFGTGAIPPDLYGLYAWVTSLDDSNRCQNIKHNPYLCLRYGDLSDFSYDDLIAFLKEFRAFAEEDPFFLGEDWRAQLNRGLGSDSIKDAFLDTISNGAPHQLVFTLLRAIRGTNLANAMVDELRVIVLDEKNSFSERFAAIEALSDSLEVNDWLGLAEKLLKSNTIDSLRISIDHIISREHMHFSGAKIAEHLIAYEKKTSVEEENRVVGIGFKIPRICSDVQVTEIAKLIAAEIPVDRNSYEHGLYEYLEEWLIAILPRLLEQTNKITVDELWSIISRFSYQLHKFGWEEVVPLWFAEHDDIRCEIQARAFDEAQDANAKRRALRWLSKISAGLHISESDAVHHLERLAVVKDSLSDWQSSWELLIRSVRGHDSFDDSVLKLAKKQAEDFPELKRILEEVMNPPIDEYETKYLERERQRKEEALAEIKQRHARFSEVREKIEKGEHLSTLGDVAESVLWYHRHSKEEKSLKERLTDMVGQDNLAPVITGFKVAVERDDIPSTRDCNNLRINEGNAYYLGRISFALSMLMLEAGEHLSFLPKKAQLCALSASWSEESTREELSKKIRTELEKILFQEHDIKRSFVKDMIESRLEVGKEIPWGFWRSGQDEIFSDILPDLALEWLTNFENVDDNIALDLLDIAIRFVDDKSKFADIIEAKIQNNDWLNEDRRRAWHVVAFFLDFDRFYSAVYKFANEDKQNLWPFRYLIKSDEYGKFSALPFNAKQIAFLLKTFAHQWPFSRQPSGVFVGSNNSWDATDYLRYLIRMLSEQKSEEAIKCLEHLIDSGCLDTYQDEVKHELANAKRAFAETRHQEINLEDVRKILSSGKPVNVSDLQALFIEEVKRYEERIRIGEEQAYLFFWDRKEPHKENDCRDRLLFGLKERMELYSVSIHVRKEAVMAHNTQVDLLLSCDDFDLPVEIKGQWNPKLWTAAREQLEEYAKNYRADETGVYLVIWHGSVEAEGKKPRRVPKGKRPESADEMRQALLDNSGDLLPKTKIVVLDVSKPASKKK